MRRARRIREEHEPGPNELPRHLVRMAAHDGTRSSTVRLHRPPSRQTVALFDRAPRSTRNTRMIAPIRSAAAMLLREVPVRKELRNSAHGSGAWDDDGDDAGVSLDLRGSASRTITGTVRRGSSARVGSRSYVPAARRRSRRLARVANSRSCCGSDPRLKARTSKFGRRGFGGLARLAARGARCAQPSDDAQRRLCDPIQQR